jgi:hypothetical protein
MAERVEAYSWGIPLRWEPNAPEAVLVSDDRGRGALAQRAHPTDPDQRCVVFRFDQLIYAQMVSINDEGRSQHRLYDAGLRDLLWLGIVRESALLSGLRPAWTAVGDLRIQPLHYVIPSKECVIEAIAAHVELLRVEGPTRTAAPTALLGD